MKTIIFKWQSYAFTLLFLFVLTGAQAQDPSAVVDFESTTQGMLAPRMTTAERGAIASPAQSLLVYDTDTESFWYYKGTDWTELGASTTSTGLVTYSGFASGAGPGNLLDSIDSALPAVVSTITLSGAGTIEAGDGPVVCLNLSHTYVGDLGITLIAPDGSTGVTLMNNNGGTGDNLTNTCFSDAANTSISSVVVDDAPFTGTWKPVLPLSAFVGQSIAGDWNLVIIDGAGGDEGRLLNWSIKIGNGEPTIANVIQDGDGDTKIQVEENFDEDQIRFDLNGAQAWHFLKTPGGRLRINVQDGNTIMGLNAGSALTGVNNTMIGFTAGQNTVGGNANTFLGEGTGRENSGSNSVMIGVGAGLSTTGSNHVLIGSFAGANATGDRKLYIDGDGTGTDSPLIYGEFDNDKLFFHANVGIGSSFDNKDLAAGYRLSVKGKIACEEVLVDLEADWPDYVFESDYDLRSLAEVQAFIDEKGHLPGVPSAEEVEDKGIEVGQMNKILMEKVEELTLYILEQNELIQAQNARLEALENK